MYGLLTWTCFPVQSAEVCGGEVTFVDLNTNDSTVLKDTSLNVSGIFINFTTEGLANHRKYNLTAKLFIKNGSTISEANMSEFMFL